MKNLDIPFIYRTHEKPKEEKVRDFINILNALGFKIKADIKRINSKSFQDILDQVKEQISNKCKDEELTKKIYQVISESGLKSMPKAIYSIDVNVGHFGLASICYAQVTSPIRRFPDLVNQNITKKVLKGKITSIEELNELREKLVYLAEHSTLKERNSIQCERDVNDMKTAEYMQNYIGEHYSGIVSGVERNRIYIRLDNLVEGSIHINDLEGDKYIHNEKMHAIIGKTTKKKYTIGSQVDIEVIAASKEERTIDFALVKSMGRKMK
jgi:ribonuclease R